MSSDRPRLGYIVGSHVMYQHAAVPRLLNSMLGCGISGDSIMVSVNGSAKPHQLTTDGVTYCFIPDGAFASPFLALIDDRYHVREDIQYWMFLNCTSRCGPRFKELSETGFDPAADASLAGELLPLGPSGGQHGRAINDLAVYKREYLLSVSDKIRSTAKASMKEIIDDLEGWYFAHAPIQAFYPNRGYTLDRSKSEDIYGTGTPRATEYYTAIDWYRYKHNYGQLPAESYQHTL